MTDETSRLEFCRHALRAVLSGDQLTMEVPTRTARETEQRIFDLVEEMINVALKARSDG